MQSLRSDETGQKLTEYNCYIGFYDFTAIQGRPIAWLIKVLGLSHVTHVGPIIEVPGFGELAITICAGKLEKDGVRRSYSKIHFTDKLERLGVKLLHKKHVGTVKMNLDDAIFHSASYTDATPWDIIFHHFVGRWIGLTRPRACTSFVCSLFNIKDVWHPATLFRRCK